MNRFFSSLFSLLFVFAVATPVFCQDTKDADVQPKQADADDAAAGDEAKSEEVATDEETEITPITIGSPAPVLDIEHWVQNGNGEFGVVTDFEKNSVYVVEFWATWCGPCIASMPHIAELQETYADRDVQVISISNEDLETVERFLDRELRGSDDEENPKTYRDLTSVYCLTTDPDGSSSRDYMRAANRNGIPCAFIVGKQGLIEWIGHPMAMDDALEQIVSDEWDRGAFAEEYIAQQEARELLTELSRLMRRSEIEEAVKLLDDYIANGKLEDERKRFKQIKFQVLASDPDYAEQAADYAIELMADESLDATSANGLSWNIYLMARAGRYQNDRVIAAAIKLAQSKEADAGEIRPFLLDTVAHLQHLQGNLEQALATQRRAVKLADEDQKPRLTGFLEELEEELAEKKEEQAKAEAKQGEDDAEDADDKDDR